LTASQTRWLRNGYSKTAAGSSTSPTRSFFQLTTGSFAMALFRFRERRAHDLDERAPRARHRAAQIDQVLLGVDAHHDQVLRGRLAAAEASGGAVARHHTRRERRSADRAGGPVEHRSVGRGAA